MTSTNFSVGFGENSKNSSKVLKPPGGGSSDLFGNDNMPQTPRNSKNRMQSNIFAAPDGQKAGNGAETPRRGVAGQDSHNRLFGEVDRPYTPAKNHMKSNLPIGADLPDGAAKTNGHSKTNGHHQNGNGIASNGHSNGNGSISSNGNTNGTANGHSNGSSSALSQNGSTHKSGNPVTGEGYKSGGAAEINTTVPSLNGGGHVINKNRIPPGGFSSGLW